MLAAACTTPLVFFAEVELRGEVLHLAEVADLSPLPNSLAQRVGGTPLLRVDRGTLQTAIPKRELVTQVRARLPALAGCITPADESVVIRRRIAGATPRVFAAAADGITKGAKVAVRIQGGPFAIDRSGIAASDARPGDRLFVRTDAGQVIRAVVEEMTP